MNKQKITIQLSDDPFDTKTVTLNLPKGVKILSNQPYTLDLLKTYGIDVNEGIDNHPLNTTIQDNGITKGRVFSVEENIALVDIGSKYTAVCNLSKEPKEIAEQIKPGLNIDVEIYSENNEMVASVSGAIDKVCKQEIYESIGDNTVAYKGTVKELIHGGYWINVSGIKCFMPGSLAGLNKLSNFKELVGKEIIVMPISYSKDKDTIIVSHKKYLRTLIPSALKDLKENMKTKITGTVTGTTKFGVFAEFNKCLTGLIYKDDLVESTEDYNMGLIKPGDEISFWVKNVVKPNKIILTQNMEVKDAWENADKKYLPMSKVRGSVVSKVNYGIFVQLEEGISGLIHKSELKDRTFNVGDIVNVIIRSVSTDQRKIKMSLS